jgi:predicted adenylyl cyclase CyaB
MPLEIEVKLKVDDHTTVRERLRALGAMAHGRVKEINIFFDWPDRSLRGKDTGLRVRFSQQEGETTPQALLTVKGPAATTGLRSREAYDVTLTPHDQIVPLLKMLGFEQVLLFEKQRESWELEGCHVELDTLPHFGAFVEVEGPTEEIVQAVQEKLRLGSKAPERKSYSRMLGELVEKKSVRELRFS